jgi:hypothetical protein
MKSKGVGINEKEIKEKNIKHNSGWKNFYHCCYGSSGVDFIGLRSDAVVICLLCFQYSNKTVII